MRIMNKIISIIKIKNMKISNISLRILIVTSSSKIYTILQKKSIMNNKINNNLPSNHPRITIRIK